MILDADEGDVCCEWRVKVEPFSRGRRRRKDWSCAWFLSCWLSYLGFYLRLTGCVLWLLVQVIKRQHGGWETFESHVSLCDFSSFLALLRKDFSLLDFINKWIKNHLWNQSRASRPEIWMNEWNLLHIISWITSGNCSTGIIVTFKLRV